MIKTLVNWMKEVAWFAIPLVVFGVFLIWLFGFHRESYYHYKVRITFCDNRPERFVDHYGVRCPGIHYESNRYHQQALSSFAYNSADHSSNEVLNVCEVVIIQKELMGEYVIGKVPSFVQTKQ